MVARTEDGEQMKINLMNFLAEGEENAITTRALCTILGWNSREVTLCVNALRRSGKVICSSERGYFLPADLSDVQHFYRQMQSRQREIAKAAQSARAYILEHGGNIK